MKLVCGNYGCLYFDLTCRLLIDFNHYNKKLIVVECRDYSLLHPRVNKRLKT